MSRLRDRLPKPVAGRAKQVVRLVRALRRRAGGQPVAQVKAPFLALGDPQHDVFFGYYDVTPFSPEAPYVLAHRVWRRAGRTARRSDAAEIGFYDLDDAELLFHALGTTRTWCWQQGARLRWDPSAPGRRVLVNDLVGDRYGSRVIALDDGDVAGYDFPLYDVSPDGRLALSIDFTRLQRLRPGYGYDLCPETAPGDPAPESTGLDLLDMKSSERHLVLSLAAAAALEPHPSMLGAQHYFNHASFAPDGSRFIVFHVWERPDGRRVRLLVFDREGALSYLPPGQDHISHVGWWGADRLVAFGRRPGAGGSPRYWIIDLDAGPAWTPAANDLTSDGHPTLHPRGDGLMLTDTYPDRNSERTLTLHDLHGGDSLEAARFFSPPWLVGERRCDLHPRWSPDGSRVAVDSAHTGRREIVVIDLSDHEMVRR